MPLNAPAPATPATTSSDSPLDVLSDLAVCLAEPGEIVAKVTKILSRLNQAFDGAECSLWLYDSHKLVRSAGVGTATLDSSAVSSRMDDSSDGTDLLVVRRLVAGEERLGGLALRSERLLRDDERLTLSIAANLLAAQLAGAEHRHRLREEVDLRTRQIEEARRFTETIIDSLPVGLYVVDRDYRVQAWNRNRETGYQGVARDLAIGKSIFEVLHRQSSDTLRQEFDEVFQTGRIQQFNIESQSSGAVRTYRITKIPMRIKDGPVTHVISIGEDITDWTAAQDRFAQSEKLAAIGQLAAGVMHEINNPLATIAACAEGLSMRLDDLRKLGCEVAPQADEYTRIIDAEVQRCKHIVDGLLDFSRPRSGSVEPVDVNAAIEQTIFLVKHHERFKKVRLETRLDPELDRPMANTEQLIQVFMALLINAADAMKERGTITIRTRRGITQREAVIAEVIDEGTGIPRTDLPKIFEPFYSTKPPGRGTGLGLSICYSIVAEHGGRIEVDSAVGAGSTFRVMFPAAPTT